MASDGDRLRSAALLGSCAAFVLVPNLGALLGPGEQTRRYDTVITPPDYAFAVWGPIFAGCVASTLGQASARGRVQPVSRRTGWPLAGAYALNTAWSLAAQTGRFALTPYLLPAAAALAATAHARQQALPRVEGWAGATAASTGLLLGWTALASVVNIAAAGAPKPVAALAGASAAVAGAVAVSRRGRAPLALAAAWGLATTALDRRRPGLVRAVAAAGTAAVAAAAIRRPARA